MRGNQMFSTLVLFGGSSLPESFVHVKRIAFDSNSHYVVTRDATNRPTEIRQGYRLATKQRLDPLTWL